MIKINNIGFINFGGKIIDSHAHVGWHKNKNLQKEDLDIFVKSNLPNNDNVEKIIVSNMDILHFRADEYSGNKAILEKFSGDSQYSVLATCSPAGGRVERIIKLFKDFPNKFIGMKFHPTIQTLSLKNDRYEPYVEFAEKEGIPCVFHSAVNVDSYSGNIIANNWDNSDPRMIYELAKKHPKTPIVMAHLGAGWNTSHDLALNVLLDSIKNGDANLYADISWVDIDSNDKSHIVNAIKALKGIDNPEWKYGDQSFRLMFGSDAPLGRFGEADARIHYNNFIEGIKNAIRKDNALKKDSEKIIQELFYDNAEKLFFKKAKNIIKI